MKSKLVILLHVGDVPYALDALEVNCLLPPLPVRPIPGTPDYVRGIFPFRGMMTPVIDLQMALYGRASDERLSTRFVVVNYRVGDEEFRPLALWAGKVTESVSVDIASLREPGVSSEGATFLGKVFADEAGALIQFVKVSELLPESLQQQLFRS